jgi:hypothetical protein
MRCRKLFCSEIARQAESGVGRDAVRPDASAQSLSRSAGARVRLSRAYVARGGTLLPLPCRFFPFFEYSEAERDDVLSAWLARSLFFLIKFG